MFAIARGSRGEKLAFVRIRSGRLEVRAHVPLYRREGSTVVCTEDVATSVRVLNDGNASADRAADTGEIAIVGGLRSARIGDELGSPDALAAFDHLALPGLETVVTPVDPQERVRLHEALATLTEQDPLIDLRLGADQELAVSLYGEVQKEVVAERLERDHGVRAEFSRTRTVHIEQVDGVGEAWEPLGTAGFTAGVGLRVEPAPPGVGVDYERESQLGSLLLSFHTAIEETVRASLAQGLSGWRIPDVRVTLTRTAYDSVGSTASDFRNLTPLVLFEALERAGTTVCEPMSLVEIEAPAESISALIAAIVDADGVPGDQVADERTAHVHGRVPTQRVHDLRQLLPGLSSGQGTLSARPGGHRRVRKGRPTRQRTDGNPLDRTEYLRFLRGRG